MFLADLRINAALLLLAKFRRKFRGSFGLSLTMKRAFVMIREGLSAHGFQVQRHHRGKTMSLIERLSLTPCCAI